MATVEEALQEAQATIQQQSDQIAMFSQAQQNSQTAKHAGPFLLVHRYPLTDLWFLQLYYAQTQMLELIQKFQENRPRNISRNLPAKSSTRKTPFEKSFKGGHGAKRGQKSACGLR